MDKTRSHRLSRGSKHHSKPVPKLVRLAAEGPKRARWNLQEHARWQRKISGGKLSRSDAALARARADRTFTTVRK
jgi:hypothetical protein